MPAVAFSVVTLLMWGALITVEGGTDLAKITQYEPLYSYPHWRFTSDATAPRCSRRSSATLTTRSSLQRRRISWPLGSGAYFLRSFMGGVDTKLGLVSVGAVGLSLLVLIIVIFPAVLTEWQSPRLSRQSKPDAYEAPIPENTARTRSIGLGLWLSFAFRAARLSGELLGFACIISFVALVVSNPLTIRWIPGADSLLDSNLTAFGAYGNLLAGAPSASLPCWSEYRAPGWASGRCWALRWTWTTTCANCRWTGPRARLAERMSSLLRYVSEWRSESTDRNSGYDAIVIIAHSQGTVITADLLRYLKYTIQERKEVSEPRLARIASADDRVPLPIYLFTMGSPLTQLYALRFPHLYQWMGVDRNDSKPVGLLMGVRKWVNVYRSADYVGRSVWRTDDNSSVLYDPAQFLFGPRDKVDALMALEPDRDTRSLFKAGDSMVEYCLGAGAHTHYWDESADLVGEQLDRLVCEATTGSVSASGVLYTPVHRLTREQRRHLKRERRCRTLRMPRHLAGLHEVTPPRRD